MECNQETQVKCERTERGSKKERPSYLAASETRPRAHGQDRRTGKESERSGGCC